MFLKRSKSGRSTVRPGSVIHEPESQRLQRDIELITSRLEHEKRESNYLDERIEMMLHELSLLSQKAKPSKKPVSSKTKTLKSTLAILEKSLEIEIVQLNEAVAKKNQNSFNNRRVPIRKTQLQTKPKLFTRRPKRLQHTS